MIERKKTWFSYVLWLIYAGLTGVLLASFLSAWCVRFGGTGKFQIAATVGLGFVLLAGIWLAVSWCAEGLVRRLKQDRHLADMWECFLALSLYAGVLLYWIYSVLRSFAMTSGVRLEADGLMVQGITLPLFYLSLRWLIGRPEALCAAAVLVLSPAYIQTVVSHAAEGYYFTGCTVCLFLIGIKQRGEILCRKKKTVICFLRAVVSLFFGIGIGILGYYHLAGWCLLILAAGRGAEDRIRDVIKTLFLTVLGATLGVAVPAWGDSLRTGRSIHDVFMIWQEQNGRVLLSSKILPEMGDSLVMNTAVIALSALMVIGFWFRNTRKQDPWIVLLLSFILIDILGMGTLGQELLLTAAWSICAGIGAASICQREDFVKEVKQAAEQESGEFLADREDRCQSYSGMEEISGNPMSAGRKQGVQLTATGVRLLENPLPTPQKHVSRSLDYEREPEEWEMGYDLPVHEEDDFDVL